MSRMIARSALLLVALATLAPRAVEASSIGLTDFYDKLVRWPLTTIPYHLNPAGSADIDNGSDIAAITKSFAAWTSLSCSSIEVSHVGNAGNTSMLTNSSPNGKNELHWVETSAWGFGKYTLGVTAPLYGYNGNIVEADIAFNGYLQSWSTTGSWSAVDVEGIAVHEIGHFFGIQHNLSGYSQSNPPTMAPSWDGTLKARTLEPDDVNSFCFLYDNAGYSCASDSDCPYVVKNKDDPQHTEYYADKYSCSQGKCVLGGGGGTGTTGTKGIGEACSGDFDCKTAYFCQPVYGQGSFCSKLCQPGQAGTCPPDLQCIPYQNQSNGACIPGGEQTEPNGASCDSSAECTSGYCGTNPVSGANQCREQCDTDASACEKSEICVPSHGATSSLGACWPIATLGEVNRPDTSGCEADWQCKSGRCMLDEGSGTSVCRAACTPAHATCAAGTWCVALTPEKGACVPGEPPPPPPKLEVDSICQFAEDCASGLCIKLPGASRSTCQLGCSLAADGCPDGQVCGGIGDPDDGVCLPEAKPVGAPCEEGAECTTRLCIGQSGATVCVQACTAEGAAGCPCATTCVTLTDGGSACLPNAGAEPCAAAGAGCASNLDCSTGRCEAGACSGASGGSGADAGLGSSGDATGDAAGGVGGPGVGGHADLSGDQVDAGTASGGCSAGPGPAGGGALLLFLAAALLSRRRHA